MNLLTLLGAAAGCEAFCKLLSENPVKAAQSLGFTLTRMELDELQCIFAEEYRMDICMQFGELRAMLCKKRPCTFAPVIPDDEDFCPEEENAA
jgi:hypothetical protein